MARIDDDSWDITEGVGATAMGMAVARAAEASKERPLFDDPYAQYFVDAALAQGWTPKYTEAAMAQIAEADPGVARFIQAMTDYGRARTKFLDDFFAGELGDILQVVILAAGLDVRAWRLPWAEGTVAYEIDMPRVLGFKLETLRARGAEATARVVSVPFDLRNDWPKALRQHGFDDSVATAWSVEGLLPYLPPDAQDLLFERLNALSAPGSRLVVDAYTDEFYSGEADSLGRANTSRMRTTKGASGAADMLDRDQLLFSGTRTDVCEWLAQRGWTTTRVSAVDTMTRYGHPPPEDVDAWALSADFVTARKNG
jgi:methyltransferase (TIGR00027 family)